MDHFAIKKFSDNEKNTVYLINDLSDGHGVHTTGHTQFIGKRDWTDPRRLRGDGTPI
jgi:hypothetical protein